MVCALPFWLSDWACHRWVSTGTAEVSMGACVLLMWTCRGSSFLIWHHSQHQAAEGQISGSGHRSQTLSLQPASRALPTPCKHPALCTEFLTSVDGSNIFLCN